MKLLYVDNYRGFFDTYIPIENVNFLVGENSTGKTSILSILNFLSDPDFIWLRNEFNKSECELGNFNDIVSSADTDNKFFTIGYVVIDEQPKHSKDKNVNNSVFILTYSSNDKGNPQPVKFTYTENNKIIHSKINDNSLSYTVSKQNVKNFVKNLPASFRKIISEHLALTKGNKEVKLPEKEQKLFSDRVPLFVIKDILERALRDTSSVKHLYNVSVWGRKLIWLAPVREKPKRIYSDVKPEYDPEGTHTPYILNDILNDPKQSGRSKFIKFLEKFGKESGLFKEVTVKRYERDNSASPFEVSIVLATKPLKIINVGYGVSQILPVIVESFIRGKGAIFAVQQPEVHLHPKAQGALGEFFHDLAIADNKKFMVETHSDFLIDRFRLKYKSSKSKSIKAQTLFFERVNNKNICHPIKICQDGKYQEDQPNSFKSFFIDEQMKLLDI